MDRIVSDCNGVIHEENNLVMPNGFEEKIIFTSSNPFSIYEKHFLIEDNVPLHYATTIEVLFCENLKGHVFIDNTQYELGDKQLFVIPPNTVHSNSVFRGNGRMYVLKFSLPDLNYYINIDNYLSLCNCTVNQFAYLNPDYDYAMEILNNIINSKDGLPRCLSYIMELFRVFARYHNDAKSSQNTDYIIKDSKLQDLISWTEEHFSEKISIDSIANQLGYSKFYFCSMFKHLTGTTYLNYLNSVRISHACVLLKDGKSVQDVSDSCGFTSPAYFIQVFKSIQHMTPHQYSIQLRQISL